MAKALWYTAPGTIELRAETLPAAAPGQVLVRTQFSGLSRGTERLVFEGAVPESEWQRMRAPYQAGVFPFPVKYGYSAAGTIAQGPAALIGRPVFGLFPHQDLFLAGVEDLIALPDAVPLKRATLAANMETALNAIWDSAAGPGDQIVVIGAGVVGLLTAFVATRLIGTEVTLIDTVPDRAALANTLGVDFAHPEAVPRNADIVFHTSATDRGLATAIACAGFEATIVEMSWYGDRTVAVPLGGAFHSLRLRLVASQVGHVATGQRARWSRRRRLEAAVRLLAAPELDEIVTNEIAFSDLADKLPPVFGPDWSDLPPVIRYA
jgi:threonine dehydrogenase-like Zn-dependent dehydrogenase